MQHNDIGTNHFGFDPGILDNDESAVSTRQPEQKPEKPGKKNAKKVKSPGRIARFFNDRRTSIFSGILIICWATFTLFSAISYFTGGASDQSLVMDNTISEIADSGNVQNAGGAFGAVLAHNAISNGFGIGALILIAYFYILGWRLLNRSKVSFWGLTAKSLIDTIATSIVLGFVTYNFNSWVYWGGIHGYEVNTWLKLAVGNTGAALVSIVLVALVACIYLNELRLLYVSYRRKVNARKLRIKQQREKAEADKRKVEETLSTSDREIEGTAQETAEQDAHQPQPTQLVDFSDSFIGNDDTNSFDDDNTIDANNDTTSIPNDDDSDDIIADDDDTDSAESQTETIDPELTIDIPDFESEVNVSTEAYDPTAELSRFHFPSIDLLNEVPEQKVSVDQQEMEENKERIKATLANYQIPISQIKATVGPTVTLYEIVPAEGVRIAKIKRLEDDIALSLAALGIRIIAPIPGKGTIGIEVPNKEAQMVPIRSVIASRKFQECKYELPMAMGATISKDIFIADLTKMPHVLVAGATGQGKSVGLNVIIASLLYKKHPAELKFVLVDPKMVEFSLYSKLEKHYLAKLPDEEEAIITDPMKVVATLNSCCLEMDNRYALLKEANVRTIKEYNAKFIQRKLNPEKGHRYLPYIVIVVDEFGDLIMMAGKEVEQPIARIAQKARAVGMHMILATQRPSTNVITGIIKANFPGRIAFRVSQRVDSQTILDRPGANQLIGKGDMLFSFNGEIDRVQCAFISTEEVENIVESIHEQIGYSEAYPLPEYVPDGDAISGALSQGNDNDPLFEEAARFIVTSNTASTSSLQRRYSIGYNRAGKLMDQMEAAGIVGPASGAKPRQVLVDSLQLERLFEQL
jgi:S-DNA-T family DNA segregation ATPase FtsK/SpoIIIE